MQAIINRKNELRDESHYRKLLPLAYEKVKAKVEAELKKCDFVSCTSDIWSGNDFGFISLTAEGVKNNFVHEKYCLAVTKIDGLYFLN